MNPTSGPIGVFDSGYGGLTILKDLVEAFPNNNFLYLGDNLRAPYGSQSFEAIYQYTLQAVEELFKRGCNLVILACNTASAKALRTIQQNDLPKISKFKRVLGIIRPTAEIIGNLSKTKHIGILGTEGTINSQSYVLEIGKFFPSLKVIGEACPMWVPLVENLEADGEGADYFVKKYIDNILEKDSKIDTLILACTHYPLLIEKIKKITPSEVKIVTQGEYVAQSLISYLKKHNEIDNLCLKEKKVEYLTTGSTQSFDMMAKHILGYTIQSKNIILKNKNTNN